MHGVIDVLDESVPHLNVLAADGWHGFFVPVRFLVRLVVVVIVVAEPWQEGSHDGPTSQQLGIDDLIPPCCTEPANVTAGHRLSRKADTKDQWNIHLHEFPVRRTIACPQASITMDANEATTSDDKVTFGWPEALQSLVGSFTQVVVEQTADLGKGFFVNMGALCGIPNKR